MTSAGRPGHEAISVGTVLTELRPDFPDLSLARILFLVSEGLVTPSGARSGSPVFTAADVSRLRVVLTAQRDHGLPLSWLRDRLAADPSWSGQDGEHPEPCPGETAEAAGRPARLTREEMLAAADIDEVMLVELEHYGLVRSGAVGFFDRDAVRIARLVRQAADYGLEPRHLRALRTSADRQVALMAQAVAPLHRPSDRDPHAGLRAEERLRELAALSTTLYELLLRSSVRSTGGW
ncbi:hypothetical protein [Actinoalloteichus spitiensis]|uniref:transcriptional regulator FtsR n=1 Tax=Actinoalloteichus spitiensis TaxID=252394 RepID=UPI000361DF6A|nr:hypothetical protein [Actinoalloteichus spitiensis]